MKKLLQKLQAEEQAYKKILQDKIYLLQKQKNLTLKAKVFNKWGKKTLKAAHSEEKRQLTQEKQQLTKQLQTLVI